MAYGIGRSYDVHAALDAEVAVAAAAYVAERLQLSAAHSVFAVLHDAEKRHLAEYLEPTVGDRYVAGANFPVPVCLHDLVRHPRDPSEVLGVDPELVVLGRRHLLVRKRDHLEVREPCDLDALSESAIDCLDEAIHRARMKRGGKRSVAAGDLAWRSTPWNATISWSAIAATLPDGHLIVEHLDDPCPG